MVERGILLAAYPIHDGDWDAYTSGCCSTKRTKMEEEDNHDSVRNEVRRYEEKEDDLHGETKQISLAPCLYWARRLSCVGPQFMFVFL